MSDLYHFYDLYTTRKYVEQFSNGVTIYSFYLHQVPNSKSPPIESTIYQVMKEASLLYCLPTTPFQPFFQSGALSLQEAIYGYIGWIFCQHFLNRLGSEYTALASIVNLSNVRHVEVLSKIKKRLRSDTFTRDYILDIIKLYPELIKLLYNNFAIIHHVSGASSELQPSLSVLRIQNTVVLSEAQLREKIKKTVQNSHELMVLYGSTRFSNLS
jgi:glutamate dehydrogenase